MQSKKLHSYSFFLYLIKAGYHFPMNKNPNFNLQLPQSISRVLVQKGHSVNYVYHKPFFELLRGNGYWSASLP